MMHYYPGIAQLNNPYTALIRWTCKEMNARGHIIIPNGATTFFKPSLYQQDLCKTTMLCVKNLIYFHLITQYHNHTNVMTKYMEDYLSSFQ